MSPWVELPFIAGASFAAGAVNAVAGGGSLIAFPALLAVGYDTVPANVVSTIGLVPGYIGSAAAYRGELADQRTRMRTLGVTGAIGGVTGAVLLLVTSEDLFRAIVPWLVLASCLLLALQGRIGRLVSGRHPDRHPDVDHIGPGLHASTFVSAVYGSYFGAGLGVMLLAALGIFLADDLQRLNGLKAFLSVVINGAAVAVFVFSNEVVWSGTVTMAVASYAGGHIGAGVARRLGADQLRAAVLVIGVTVAAVLFVKL